MNTAGLLKLIHPTSRSVHGITTVRYYGNFCRRCYGNFKVGVRYIQYKANQPQFVTQSQLKASKYGIVVYESKLLADHNAPRAIRAFIMYMTVSLPIVCFIAYCDLVLRNEKSFEITEWYKRSGILILILVGGLIYAKYQSKRSIKRLYFNRKEKKIYIESFTGLCKEKTYGPYEPSIGVRRITTAQNKHGFYTQEHLIFQGRPLTARSMSRKEIVNETVKGMSDLKSPHAIITQVEGHDMGNREFRIEVDGTNMKEKKLYTQLFRIHQHAEPEEEKKKARQFD